MKHLHDLEKVDDYEFDFGGASKPENISEWVIVSDEFDSCPWDEAQAHAIYKAVCNRYGRDVIRNAFSGDDYDCIYILMDPSNPEAVQMALNLCAEAARGIILDQTLYHSTLKEHAERLWESAPLSFVLTVLKDLGHPLEWALREPDEEIALAVAGFLEEHYS